MREFNDCGSRYREALEVVVVAKAGEAAESEG